jgi:hypothetical protein
MSNQYGMKASRKPLKGQTVTSNYGNFDTLVVSNLQLENINIAGLFQDGVFENVIIRESQISNTVIGVDSPNVGNFTNLKAYQNVNFLSNMYDSYVSWDPSTSEFTINNGVLKVNGCSYLDNIEICRNDISAVNLNGGINMYPNGVGSLNLYGPININSTFGSFYSKVSDGGVTFNIKDDFVINSSKGSNLVTTFDKQLYNTINGDIELRTETLDSLNISLINVTSSSMKITTYIPHNLLSGDSITLSNVDNSLDNLGNTYVVNQIFSDNSFSLNYSSSLLNDITKGSLQKVASNNIFLNTSSFVQIPTDTKLSFGTSSNTISGNTGSLLIKSLGNATFNVPSIQIPESTPIHFTSLVTSGTGFLTTGNKILYDGTDVNFSANNKMVFSSNTTQINSTNTRFYDPVLTIGDYTLQTADLKDRGIEYRYLNSSGSMKTGWFGYKISSNKFTFIPDSTNINETISGIAGELEIGNISANNITIKSGGSFDLNCGELINTNKIIGCGGYLNILSTNQFNLTAGSISLGASTNINIPNNIPINLGTSGSYVIETTSGNINISSLKNVSIFTQSKGSIYIPVETKISFNASNSVAVYSNTFGNLYIDGNKSIYLTTTSGNIILPQNISGATSSSLQFGNDSEVIYGNTTGIYIFSKNSINESSLSNINQNASGNLNQTISGNVNETANGNVNITSILGNISLQSNTGDINLFTTSGNTRLLQGSRIIFGISGTSNSIRADTIGNLVINGNNSNIVDIKNVNSINLNAKSNINISTGTTVYFSSDNSKYIVSDTTGNFNITNNTGTTILDSVNTIINNTSGSLSIKNTLTNISSSSLIVSGNTVFLNTQDVKIRDPILTLANYSLVSNDLLDRGIEYNYFLNSLKQGWFGRKNNTNLFTYYSDSINNNEIINGTLGSAQFDSLYLQNGITFSGTGPGQIDMKCGTIANLNTILGCNGTVNISTGNILLSGTSKVILPYNTPLSFGTTNNSISADSNGSFIITAMGGSGTVVLNSNVQINGTTSNVYSTVTNIKDPILSIGGVTGPLLNDGKDRGIEFKWNNDNSISGSRTGFFGYKNSLERFVFIQNGINNDEVFSGSYGNVQFGNAFLTNLDLQNGTISNVNTISSKDLTPLQITSNNGINLSSGNINIPFNSFLNFGSTNNSISANTSGNLNINTSSGNVNFLLSTSGNSSINFPENVPLNFGNVSSGNYIISNTNGSLTINNSSGNINLSPKASSGSINIPTNNYLNFGVNSTKNSMYSDGQQLIINGYSGININSTSFNISGNVNVTGTITAAVNTDFDLNRYILPLGTSQILNIASVENYSSSGSNFIKVTTSTPTNYTTGDSVTLSNSGSIPSVDGTYTVSGILSPTSFFINYGTPITTTGGSVGTIKSNLMTYQGKDVGIQINYWNSSSVTAGSAGYKTGFFGFKNNTNRWAFYNNATITDNIVTGSFSDIQVNTVYTTFMSGFGLQGPVSAGSNQISGNNFQIVGGSINGTPIGANTAQTARFSTLSNTVSASLQNVTLTSSLAYTFERYTLSSSGLTSRNPSISYVVSLFSVSGPSYTTSSGTMPSNTANIPDGTFKMLVCSSLGIGSSHTVFFGANKLIAPNPLDSNAVPTKIVFKRQGQTAKLLFDAQGNGGLGTWILLTSGVYVS